MTTRALPWTPPPATDVQALPAGKWWDAVRAAPTVGERALKLLGDDNGAVIQDKYGTLYWLVAVGSATSWHLRQVRVLTELADECTYLGVPPNSWTTPPGTHWRVPLSVDHYLTDAWKLWGALAEADRVELGPIPQGRQTCYRCELPTDEPVIVDVQHGGSGPGRTVYACPTHALAHRRDPLAEAAAMRRARERGHTR
ncbi:MULTISPECIES: hypothetical protein [Streptomyces violaceusniger group]|uniref:hypothetical protein n=1 Tax=Streptomyces violaceusniger group TaxID=2839105 RepID=UPI000A3A0D97|nr:MULTISPECIES: hypothetical protein [Streptomyces violaceusniger group]